MKLLVNLSFAVRVMDLLLASSSSYHSVDGQQLVSSLQPPLAVSHPLGDHSGDVDRGVLLFAPHDVKAKTLFCLGKLHHPWVGMALAGCKGCHGGLVREGEIYYPSAEVPKSITRS